MRPKPKYFTFCVSKRQDPAKACAYHCARLQAMNKLRILSLLPAATEIIYQLGLENNLIGVSHECDYPSVVKQKPQVTSSTVQSSMSSKKIDQMVKKGVHKGLGVFHINEEILKKLRPNLILTQELCQVCAVGFNQAWRRI